MHLPEKLLQSLEGIPGYDRNTFERVHSSDEQVTSIRLNPLKPFNIQHITPNLEPVGWTRYGFYLDKRPSFTFDPLFHAGCYYVQEASSMFIEQALQQTTDLSQSLKVLDLCAAPGGKSTHLQSLISPGSLLVSNEVIRSRASVLRDNLIKWGSANVVVTNNDPKDFERLTGYFDVIVADAPCSGSGLFRREPEAVSEWSENNVMLCNRRQQRILADVLPALKKEGLLIYATCSYSREEDEDMLDWLTANFKIENVKLKFEDNWGIVETTGSAHATGYRFWPDKLKGEGFFIACYRKKDGMPDKTIKSPKRKTIVSKKDEAIAAEWISREGFAFIKNDNVLYAWPEKLVEDMNRISGNLHLVYSGVRVGELVREKMIPDHPLAMSGLTTGSINRVRVNYDEAIAYLQRKDMGRNIDGRGWHLVDYEGHSLGWVNVLPGRTNNYYPKDLRILKDKANHS